MKKNIQKNKPDHPTFLINDQQQSNSNSHTYCQSCCRYEQDISILQQKLMQTHNKLIQQIDICREQEIKIIKLQKQNSNSRGRDYDRDGRDRDVENNVHVMNRQQSGKIIRKNQEQFIQPLVEARTQLLRNDLQAMRAKVLSQISKSNKLKQQAKQVQNKHERQIQQYREKIKKIEIARNKTLDQNDRLLQQIQRIKKTQEKISTKCLCGFEQKYYELDKAFMNQRTVTNQLIQENSKLQNKVKNIHYQRDNDENNYHNHRDQIHTEPKRKRHHGNNGGRQKHPKQQFQATKNLIKRLENAEIQIRNKNGQALRS